jgi:hypothetical protein
MVGVELMKSVPMIADGPLMWIAVVPDVETCPSSRLLHFESHPIASTEMV